LIQAAQIGLQLSPQLPTNGPPFPDCGQCCADTLGDQIGWLPRQVGGLV